MHKQKFDSKFWWFFIDISINKTLLCAYVYDTSYRNASIISIVYVSTTRQIGFFIKGCFKEFLDSFCEECPNGVVCKIQIKTIETQCPEHY